MNRQETARLAPANLNEPLDLDTRDGAIAERAFAGRVQTNQLRSEFKPQVTFS